MIEQRRILPEISDLPSSYFMPEATHSRMGAWGTAIFSDDTASDVRDAFTDFVAEGLSPSEATERLVRESEELLTGEDDAVVFWLALAATQWKLGRLLDDVRDRAVAIIDDGGGTCCNICLLGLDDGQAFTERGIALADTLGPHYTMLSHEPADRITLLARDVEVPEQQPESFRVWNNLTVHGHACTWDQFPDALRTVLPKLGWR